MHLRRVDIGIPALDLRRRLGQTALGERSGPLQFEVVFLDPEGRLRLLVPKAA